MSTEIQRGWRRLADAPWPARLLVSMSPGLVLGFLGTLLWVVPLHGEWTLALEQESTEFARLDRDWREYVRLRNLSRPPDTADSESIKPYSPAPQVIASDASWQQFFVGLADNSALRLERLQLQAQSHRLSPEHEQFVVRLMGRFQDILDFLEQLSFHHIAVGIPEFAIEAAQDVDALTFEAVLRVSRRDQP